MLRAGLPPLTAGLALVGTTSLVRADPGAPSGGATHVPVVEVHASPRPPSYFVPTQTTGTRADQPVHDLPQSMTVLDRTVIDDIGARRVEDALPLVPGVQLFSGYGGTWDDYTIRGFRVWAGTTHRNGYLNGYSGAHAADTVNVERIEVIRGPASALYGPALPGGAVNLVTKRPKAERQLSVGVWAGSFTTLRNELDATGPMGPKVNYRLTASASSTEGYRDYNSFSRWLVNPAVEFAPTEDTKLLVELQAYRSSYRADPLGVPWMVKGAIPVERSYVDPSLPRANFDGGLARVELDHKLSRRWALRVAIQNQIGQYVEKTILWGPPGEDGRMLERALMNWRQYGGAVALQSALRGEFSTGPFRHGVVVGLDAARERVAYRTAMSDPASAPLPIDVFNPRYGAVLPEVSLPSAPNTWSYGVVGLYANDVVTLLPRLKVMLGVRVDTFAQESSSDTVHDRASEVAVTPRAGAVFDVIDGVSAFANVSTGFWPSLGVTATGNVLRPEHSFSTEAGVRGVLMPDVVTLDVAAFRIDNRNFAVADADNPNFQHNIGEALSTGIEAMSTARLGRIFRCLASYAYTDARVVEDPAVPARVGQPLPLAAAHSGGAWGQFDLPITAGQKAGIGVGSTYTSERTLPDQSTIPGYVRFDAMLSYAVPHVRAALRFENLADTQYVKSGLNQYAVLFGAPRNVLLTLDARL